MLPHVWTCGSTSLRLPTSNFRLSLADKLVARDVQGKPYTVRYEAVNAILLNEFLKEHRKVEELEATVAAQQKAFESQIGALTAALKTQAAQIQKVCDQIRAQAPAPRVVAND